jgi:hypothetical protein
MGDSARTIKLLTDILKEGREARTENQRLHAHTDVMLMEAIHLHNEDPGAHAVRFSAVERRVSDVEERLERLEGKRDDESPK